MGCDPLPDLWGWFSGFSGANCSYIHAPKKRTRKPKHAWFSDFSSVLFPPNLFFSGSILAVLGGKMTLYNHHQLGWPTRRELIGQWNLPRFFVTRDYELIYKLHSTLLDRNSGKIATYSWWKKPCTISQGFIHHRWLAGLLPSTVWPLLSKIRANMKVVIWIKTHPPWRFWHLSLACANMWNPTL